jgi:hypothetical protein
MSLARKRVTKESVRKELGINERMSKIQIMSILCYDPVYHMKVVVKISEYLLQLDQVKIRKISK